MTQSYSSTPAFPVASRDHLPAYTPLNTFELPKGADRHYVQQYADMYFLRLVQLKPIVEQNAAEKWAGYTVHATAPLHHNEASADTDVLRGMDRSEAPRRGRLNAC